MAPLTFRFLVNLKKFLKPHLPEDHNRKMENNTVMKHIQRLRKMETMAFKLERITKNPFNQLKFEKFDREYLTEIEI